VAKKKKTSKTKKIGLGNKLLYNPRVLRLLDFIRPEDPSTAAMYFGMNKGGYIKCPTKKKKKKPRGVGAALKGYGKALS
jgi:hypothetical protein